MNTGPCRYRGQYEDTEMILRKLAVKDAPLMLEWMHDPDCVKYLKSDFLSMTIDNCLGFIRNSLDCETDMHLAVADDNDEYMGTVSLKHIDREKLFAEFAISIRRCAMGKGYSSWGMRTMLEKGIDELGLVKIYWCVSEENERAVRFYDKNGYKLCTDVPRELLERYDDDHRNTMLWYSYPDDPEDRATDISEELSLYTHSKEFAVAET